MAQQVVFAPQYQSPYERTIMPSMMQLLTGLALAKVQHKWNLETVEAQSKLEQAKEKREQTWWQQQQVAGEARTKREQTHKAQVTAQYKQPTEAKPPAAPKYRQVLDEATGMMKYEEWGQTPEGQYGWIQTGKTAKAPPQKAGEKPPSETDLLNRTTTLRKEFVQQSKTFIDVRDSFQRIQASAKEPSAAGDLALVFNFMKMLDPQSVVREGEFATAQNATGVPQQIRNIYNKIMEGKRLAPEQRKDFVGRAGQLMNRQKESHYNLRQEYGRIAKSYKVKPQDVLVDLRMQLEVGEVYVDDLTGEKRRYLGEGKWESVNGG